MKKSLQSRTRRSGLARACVCLLIVAGLCHPASANPGSASSAASSAVRSTAEPEPSAVTGVHPKSAAPDDAVTDADVDAGTGDSLEPEGAERDGKRAKRQQPAPGELVLALEVNGNLVSEFAEVFIDGKGRYFATAELLTSARMKVPNISPLQVQETQYYPLDAIQGIKYRFDAAQQKLALTVPAPAFAGMVLELAAGTHEKAMRSDPGFFLNHDIQVAGSGMEQVNVSASEEVGFFSKLGVFTTRYVGRDLTTSPVATRLDSQFVRDFPDHMATLTIGDSPSASSPWGMVVNYAGVRFASKFATQPSFIPFALPSLAGQAAQPSTVDLYVNNVLTSHQNVDTGPFAIRDIPTITPQGDVRMVVTDMMGRQQVASAAFIATPQLLRKGVNDYTYEAGMLRNGFGFQSFGYHSWFAAGTHKRGLTDSLTLNLRGELESYGQTVGAGLDKGFPLIGVLGAGVAVSRNDKGQAGGLAYAHLQHATRTFGFSASAQATTDSFQQLGLAIGEHPTKFLGQLQISRELGRRASVSLAYLRQEKPSVPVFDRDGNLSTHFSAISPGVNINLRGGASLVFSASYAPELQQRASANVSLMIPIGHRRTMTASSGFQDGRTSPSIEVTKQIPVATGWGYRVRTSSNDMQDRRVDAGITYQSSIGTYQLETGQQSGTATSWRFDYSGGTVLMHRQLALSRPLSDGFVMVDASGAAGIRVLANNQYIGTTNRKGFAIVPNLPSYNANVIALDDKDVSLDLDVDFSQKILVPMPRSGLLVNFRAAQIRGAVLKLVTEDGTDVPVGAEATVNHGQGTYEVVLRGELFIPEIAFPATVRAHWDEGSCQAIVPAPQNADELLPRIGPIVCRKIK